MAKSKDEKKEKKPVTPVPTEQAQENQNPADTGGSTDNPPADTPPAVANPEIKDGAGTSTATPGTVTPGTDKQTPPDSGDGADTPDEQKTPDSETPGTDKQTPPEPKSEQGKESQAEKTQPIEELALELGTPSWQQSALCKLMEWEPGKQVSMEEYCDGLAALSTRRQGGGVYCG